MTPHAIILAAGVGRRLARLDAPHAAAAKILLRFDGVTLLARHLAILHRCGVSQVTLVLGHEAAAVRRALADVPAGLTVHTLQNPDFTQGSLVSLWVARDVLRSGAPILLMDGDVLYDHRLLARLLASRHPDAMLLDREIEPGDEPVKLCLRGGVIVDFRKKPTEPHDLHGESVGFFRFSAATAAELAGRLEGYVAGGQRATEYEEAIRDMILHGAPGRFGYEDITGLPWTEIDFPEDVAKAAALAPDLVA